MQTLQDVALRLDYMVGQITVEELGWQEANFVRDSALGRELLFLIADNRWVRSTSETIDITRSDTIDTTISIELDLDRITHEAFRDRPGQLSLPILVLSPLEHQLPEQDPFSTLTVSDAGGNPLAALPDADVRHRVAAALTEIILNVEAGLPHARLNATRDHRLLLSAAIYRLLRSEHVPTAVLKHEAPARRVADGPLPRLGQVRQELGEMLQHYSALLAAPGTPEADAASEEPAFVRRLTERAITVLRAFAESAVVVVSADRGDTPAVLSVKVPGRALHQAPTGPSELAGSRVSASAQRWAASGWSRWLRPANWILPGATLQIDLLVPSSDADRRVQVNLPDGVSPDPSLPQATRAVLDIRTEQPSPVAQLADLTTQLDRDNQDWPMPLYQCVADLAGAKADAVRESLRDHQAGSPAGQPTMMRTESTARTSEFRERLDKLSAALADISAHGLTPEARQKLRDAWDGEKGDEAGRWLRTPMKRRTSTDTVSPDIVVARSRMIEDASQRAAPTEARMQVHIAVTDSEYFSTSQFSGWMSVLLMAVVLLFFVGGWLARKDGSQVSAEVLAFVLTLFSAFQVGRIPRPGRSTVRNLLAPAGNPLIIASILPTVILAVALAFSRAAVWAIAAAGICICLQLLLLPISLLMRQRAFERGRQPAESYRPRTGMVLYTDPPRYARTDVLRSGWWRNTTADALMVGRQAYGYVVWQHGTPQTEAPRTLRSLLYEGQQASQPGGPQPRLPAWLRNLGTHPLTSAAGAEPGTNGADDGADDGRPPDDLGPDISDAGSSPLEQPANLLALQSAGTGGQALTFAVFRDEPKADWAADGVVRKVDLDPGRLAPAEDVSGVIGIFVGLPRGHCLRPIGEHPVTRVLLAARHRLAVLEVQMPFPAPLAAYADLQWARVQLGLQEGDIKWLTPLLDDIEGLIAPARHRSGQARPGEGAPPRGLVVGVQTVAAGIPRILNPRPAAANPGPHADSAEGTMRSAPLVPASDLDVVATSGLEGKESPAAKSWRVMAVGADWRGGIETEILTGLDPDLDLAGLSYAVMHGKAVVLLLAHRQVHPVRPLRSPGRRASPPTGPDPAARAAALNPYLDAWQSRLDLGAAERHPLLRVRMRTPDRPGATLEVLESLRETLLEMAPESLREGDLRVWYARVVVAHGNVAQIQLTARLAVDAALVLSSGKALKDWGSAEFSMIERQVLARAARKMVAARDSAGPADPGSWVPEDTVISVGLVNMLELVQPTAPANGENV
jgi:hypothetical protein